MEEDKAARKHDDIYYNLVNPPPREELAEYIRPPDGSPRPAPKARGISNASSRSAVVVRPIVKPRQSRPGNKSKSKRTRKQEEYMRLQYSIEETPPWYIAWILGFQHYLIMFGATVANPLFLAPHLCIEKDDFESKSNLIGTMFVVAGISTLLQCTVGVRLPVIQGGTFTFVIPSLALLSLPQWKCPDVGNSTAQSSVTTSDGISMNYTASDTSTNMTMMSEPVWHSRIREVQGAILLASLFQVAIGFTGLMGFILRYIGPLAITPTISLAGMALFEVAEQRSSKQWWITLVTVVLIVAFSQYTKNLNIPCFAFHRGKGCQKEKIALFRLFPVLLAVSITWLLCAILTLSNVFPSDPESWGYGAATNLNIGVMNSASWFRVPYPGQWGLPTFSTAGVFGMVAGVLASMVESVGDYYAIARMSRVPPPPVHAINRGIGVEGIACILAGAFGSGSGTTSYSENIGAIGITKVASRRVFQYSGIIMIVFGVCGKFGSVFVTIPDPIIGGVFIVMFGMIVAVGLSNLQFVDLNSSRNLFIIGFSFFFGLTLPKFLTQNPDAISTGSPELDQIITVLLRTSMFVGGLTGFILDNTIPGTDEERGIITWRYFTDDLISRRRPYSQQNRESQSECRIYDLPFIGNWLQSKQWAQYVPFLPPFKERSIRQMCCGEKGDDEEANTENDDVENGQNGRIDLVDMDAIEVVDPYGRPEGTRSRSRSPYAPREAASEV